MDQREGRTGASPCGTEGRSPEGKTIVTGPPPMGKYLRRFVRICFTFSALP